MDFSAETTIGLINFFYQALRVMLQQNGLVVTVSENSLWWSRTGQPPPRRPIISRINFFYHKAASPELKMKAQIDRRCTSHQASCNGSRQAARLRPVNPVI